MLLTRLHFQYQPGPSIYRKPQNEAEPVCHWKTFVANPPYAHKGAALPPAARTAAEKRIAATKMSDEPLTHSSNNYQ
jgi:hypothetical protein